LRRKCCALGDHVVVLSASPPAFFAFSAGYVAVGEPAGRRRYLTRATSSVQNLWPVR
jgi:hypothetical protein